MEEPRSVEALLQTTVKALAREAALNHIDAFPCMWKSMLTNCYTSA
jgi:hypothetical protein